MILTERTINIIDHESIMDSPVVLYRGDKNVELKLNIKSSRFKFRDDDSSNFIESAQASYGQLIIQTPNQNEPIFSEITATKKGYIIFVITAEMIDEIDEVGAYTFQVRLLDSNKRSRATIPPVVNGIEIREPITSEDSNVLNSAVVGLASAANEEVLDTFDEHGDYAKTNWKFGDKITAAKLNKSEDGIYQAYALGLNNSSQITTKASKNDLEVERKRIDSFTRLTEGSTTGDAELIDARVGANGVIYNNLGSAIREQIGSLSDMIIPKKTINVGDYTWNTTTSFKHYYVAIEFKKNIELSKIEFSALFWNGSNKIVNLDIMDKTRSNVIKNASCSINWVDNTTPVDLEFNFNINLNSGVYYLHLSSESSSFSYPNNLTLYEDDYIKIGNYFTSGYKIYTNTAYSGGTEYDTFANIFQAKFILTQKVSLKELVDKNSADIKDIQKKISTNENYIYVSKNGNDETGDGTKGNPYATLYKANESITDNSDDKPYTIIVGKGTYTDLQEKYSGDSKQGAYKGIVCKNNVSYISEDIEHPELCVIEWNGATGFDGNITDKIASDMCAFHITGRNASKKWKTSIKGFKIVGMNLRYCLHVEQNGNSDVTIENCILDWKGTPNVEGSQKKPTVGCGGSYFQNVIFKNCVFLNSQSTAGIQWHDNAYPTSFYGEHNIYQGATFTFKDCYFDGLDLQMRSTEVDRKMPFKLKIEDCGGIRKAYFSIGGKATINYWRGHVENSIIEDDRISNATNTTNDSDLAELK